MGYLVLAAWTVQAAVGVSLLVSWVRRARGRSAGAVLTHALMMVGFLAPWAVFIATGSPLWAWVGFLVLAAFIGFGDMVVMRRVRALRGMENSGIRDYLPTIKVVISGALRWRPLFHMCFSGVVFFSTLAVAIAATIA
ncbi:hypothetical protein ACTJJ4_15410 [Microbacterium sp. 22195]|uniref:hypothetical protein n=1 Tax=Microbacterium sp. 22195 TaxID=3453891 RepID=UPI003F865CC9